jgi:hypothetical protein
VRVADNQAMNTKSAPKGYILHQNSNPVVIATLESENRKTGNMIQVWILCANVSPVESVKAGLDAIVCGIVNTGVMASATEHVT